MGHKTSGNQAPPTHVLKPMEKKAVVYEDAGDDIFAMMGGMGGEEEEEEEAGEFDDPLAMLGGMGEEEVYKVSLFQEKSEEASVSQEALRQQREEAEVQRKK